MTEEWDLANIPLRLSDRTEAALIKTVHGGLVLSLVVLSLVVLSLVVPSPVVLSPVVLNWLC